MNSTGTSQRRVADLRGGAGSDEPSGHRRERLIRREHDRPAFIGRRDGAQRVFAHVQLEHRRHIVERDELLVAHECGGERPSRVLREDGQGLSCLTTDELGQREGESAAVRREARRS